MRQVSNFFSFFCEELDHLGYSDLERILKQLNFKYLLVLLEWGVGPQNTFRTEKLGASKERPQFSSSQKQYEP
jgi:hypothetical protein